MTDSLCPLLDDYLTLVDDTECPTLYHRWAMINSVAAILNRRTKIDMPTGPIYPNLYMILLGPPAARKSTAINIATKLLRESGYSKIASGSTTPQKFLNDLYSGFDTIGLTNDSLELDLDSSVDTPVSSTRVSDVLVSEGELQDFFGINNFDFISLVTNMFDNLNYYDNRTKSGVSERIINPTICLLGGATGTSFKKMFPIDIVGQGLLSRFLLIHGAGPRKKIFMPRPFNPELQAEIVNHLRLLRKTPDLPDSFTLNPDAHEYSKILYESTKDEVQDPRFQYYNGRRNVHYMKLSMVIAAANMHSVITLDDCLLANTILSYTEKFMPKALGEFGLDKNAETTEIVYNMIKGTGDRGITVPQLLNEAMSIITNISELTGHIIRLQASSRIDKVQHNGTIKYIIIERTVTTASTMVKYDLLQEYRENSTFDTAYRSPEQELEYELQTALDNMNKPELEIVP